MDASRGKDWGKFLQEFGLISRSNSGRTPSIAAADASGGERVQLTQIADSKHFDLFSPVLPWEGNFKKWVLGIDETWIKH
jgi:hypothetical protein